MNTYHEQESERYENAVENCRLAFGEATRRQEFACAYRTSELSGFNSIGCGSSAWEAIAEAAKDIHVANRICDLYWQEDFVQEWQGGKSVWVKQGSSRETGKTLAIIVRRTYLAKQ